MRGINKLAVIFRNATMTNNKINNNRYLVYIVGLIFCFVISSCNGQTKPKIDFSKESFDFKRMDTTALDSSLNNQKLKYNSLSYDDINLGERILLGSIPKEIIKRRKITNIKVVDFIDEKYDSLSNRIYERCTSWTGATTYKYYYDKNGRPDYIISYSDTIKYNYDDQNRLIECGSLTIKYFPNGFKKSVESSGEIETYEYDEVGNICHINFDNKPGVSYCGNRTSEWFGEYDKTHRLIRDLKIGFPNSPIETYQYSEQGDLIKSIHYENIRNETSITDYIYKDKSITIKTRSKK